MSSSNKFSEACSTAETFVHLFYDKMDTTKRTQIGKLYMDTATVSWNGHRIGGKLYLHFVATLIDLFRSHTLNDHIRSQSHCHFHGRSQISLQVTQVKSP